MIRTIINLSEKPLVGLRPITDDYESGGIFYKEDWCLLKVAEYLAGSCYTEEMLCKLASITSQIPAETTQKILQRLISTELVEPILRHGCPTEFQFKKDVKLAISIGTL